MYSDIFFQHFMCPRNAYRMENPSAVGVGRAAGERAFIHLYAEISSGKFSKVSFQTYGSPGCIAVGSTLTTLLEGISISGAKLLTAKDIETSLMGIPEHKNWCLDLAISALSDLIRAAENGC